MIYLIIALVISILIIVYLSYRYFYCARPYIEELQDTKLALKQDVFDLEKDNDRLHKQVDLLKDIAKVPYIESLTSEKVELMLEIRERNERIQELKNEICQLNLEIMELKHER